jgi:hypothetical protein
MRLHLVDTPSPPSDGYEIPERNLQVMPTRPGVSQSRLSLRIPASLTKAAGDRARRDGIREDAWIGIAVESERALDRTGARGLEREALRDYLDAVAARPLPVVPGAPVRAMNFAAALRASRGQNDTVVIARIGAGAEVVTYASVPFHSEIAWRRGAIEAGQTLGQWASERIREMPTGRPLWEAAAVEAGETLAEWVLAQDARRRSAR